jgi:hypothetical protein
MSFQDPEESLVADTRATLTPAQQVEQKLFSLLKGKLVPVSQVRTANLPSVRRRSGPFVPMSGQSLLG